MNELSAVKQIASTVLSPSLHADLIRTEKNLN